MLRPESMTLHEFDHYLKDHLPVAGYTHLYRVLTHLVNIEEWSYRAKALLEEYDHPDQMRCNQLLAQHPAEKE